jgi:hypothetical protein
LLWFHSSSSPDVLKLAQANFGQHCLIRDALCQFLP